VIQLQLEPAGVGLVLSAAPELAAAARRAAPALAGAIAGRGLGVARAEVRVRAGRGGR
jgi:hypothetical protein